MKTKLSLVGGVLCGLLTSGATGENNPANSASADPSHATQPLAASSISKPAASAGSASAPVSVATGKEDPPASQPEAAKPAASPLTESQELEKAKQAHIRPASRLIVMESPPPPPRVETKIPSSVPGLVWVPGHWTPVKSEWQWTAGEWSVPATAASVWIEPRYDPKTKQWTAGYWQPDREQAYGD
jgi:hypothetical protein